MLMKLKNITKTKKWDYFILVARFLIGFTFIKYGLSKLNDGQFGISPEELATPLKDLSLFRVSWYLFNHEPFSSFIGISQIICGILLLINRTVILGAFMFLPIVVTILIIDITFMPPNLALGFTKRLTFYILLNFLILYHYKDRMIIVWNAITKGITTRYKFKIWHYLLIPILAVFLEILPNIPTIIYALVKDPEKMFNYIKKVFEAFLNSF